MVNSGSGLYNLLTSESAYSIKVKGLKSPLIAVLLLSLLLNCSGQEPKSDKIYNDTLNLRGPQIDTATAQDYYHCIDLSQGGYMIVIKGAKHVKQNLADLKSLIENKRKAIIERNISLIFGNERYNDMVAILDMLTEYKINNYKIVSREKISFSPIVIKSTKPPETKAEINDPDILEIVIQSDSVKMSFQGNCVASDLNEIDEFLLKNKNRIDPNKIFITGGASSTFKQFESIINLLGKYGYVKYHLNTKN